ncbi:MAG: hypothetical protein OEZ13_05575 [Spirochaetia bacterium]|nr:hypothetical protein [Spirochaetia bacterium]
MKHKIILCFFLLIAFIRSTCMNFEKDELEYSKGLEANQNYEKKKREDCEKAKTMKDGPRKNALLAECE